ncbi:hypothetical protein EN962_18845 [Mesorhizobium sp. M7A.F.Ca.CA.001.09.2.1]|nr:hypothetical protein EOC84_05180 [Mesorhizobium sp. Primo-B]RUU35851.1 hypothetical protein EOC83_23730 [Mesorhizobium sp. Primo-A]RUX38562.1 hypothetical protein EN987_15675 [Mesorhizobium sp. M7A.F.Ca.CA.002.11.2.1]RUX43784.1 hypothetical protein EN994_28890 [Mesorhizobium sp. M7A.F.Ca.CA.002.09.1.1]RUX56238.1 hypothetical protein EN989_23695 [Mesorhizobium sp. M7A.F.Ca.CA.002.12.1.1]RUX63882.1 hypothetical protein EOA22_19060 [Mesorhizobium sp. M7A.F.Ca.US.014.04.1.1]RUX73854.1 hypothet
MLQGKTQKPRSIGNAVLPDTHGASLRKHFAKLMALVETYGLRYARPDPERRTDEMSASQSVL